MAEARRHRVVVIEDHPIFLEGLTRCLAAEPDFAVVAHSMRGSVDLEALGRAAPDLVLVDVELPDVNGIEVTRRIRRALPDLRVVILTAFADPDLLLEATRAGAAGYLLKHMRAPELVATLRRIAAGEHVVGPDLASRVLRELRADGRRGQEARLVLLSAREEEVLKLLATGETNRQIAARLFISEETVKSHVAAILRKLEVSDRTRAAVLAVRAGLVAR
jgi:DNA-binding NarL/FixJ family response regulator